MRRDDPAALLPPDDKVIARLTCALRTLEERRRAGLSPPPYVVFFLGALDRKLTDEEREYVAMVFGACKEVREHMTATLVDRLGVARGAVIAGIRAHLEATVTRTMSSTVPEAVRAHLDRLRIGVLLKAAQVG